MAYYDDAYTWAQEHTPYFPVANYQDPVCFSNYESCKIDTNYDPYNASVFHKPESTDHGDYGYNCNYDYDNDYSYGYDYDYDYGNWDNRCLSSDPSINYFAHNYMEPKLIAYKPVECDTGYVSYHTQYSISYSQVNSGFNEPEFEEYDPTPYGGGYDIVSVYGKPLPPSDQTCYPRSKPKPIGPRHTPNSISQPVPKPGPKPEPKPMPTPMSIADPPPLVEPEPKLEPMPIPLPLPMPKPTPIPPVEPGPKLEPMPISMSKPTPIPPVEPEPEPEPKHVLALVPVPDPLDLKEVLYDYPWPEYDHANATVVGYDYGYGKKVAQIPPLEYSPEVVDLCESIFGSWPCLARIRKQQMGLDDNPRKSAAEIGHLNPWEDCANYFFGHPIASYNG